MFLALANAAKRDIADIMVFLGEESLDACWRFEQLSFETMEMLVRMPRMGHERSDLAGPEFTGIRVVSVDEFPNYLILYRFNAERVFVIRVLHGARDVPSALRELE
ncbi:MAG: type II toxin-antitoxin system RelE/ParE family toxin [Phycisphaerales bacterium]|nr:type II toxin-antitoxin system RelE/ParE family toxin [Phycisphaerales bacterium]